MAVTESAQSETAEGHIQHRFGSRLGVVQPHRHWWHNCIKKGANKAGPHLVTSTVKLPSTCWLDTILSSKPLITQESPLLREGNWTPLPHLCPSRTFSITQARHLFARPPRRPSRCYESTDNLRFALQLPVFTSSFEEYHSRTHLGLVTCLACIIPLPASPLHYEDHQSSPHPGSFLVTTYLKIRLILQSYKFKTVSLHAIITGSGGCLLSRQLSRIPGWFRVRVYVGINTYSIISTLILAEQTANPSTFTAIQRLDFLLRCIYWSPGITWPTPALPSALPFGLWPIARLVICGSCVDSNYATVGPCFSIANTINI